MELRKERKEKRVIEHQQYCKTHRCVLKAVKK
jgi:hypothetical protein